MSEQEQIQEVYKNLAAELGHVIFQMKLLERQQAEILKKIDALNELAANHATPANDKPEAVAND